MAQVWPVVDSVGVVVMYYAQKKPGRAVWYVWHEVRGIVVEVWMGSRAECEQRAADLNAGRI